jgi:hypothetical protein
LRPWIAIWQQSGSRKINMIFNMIFHLKKYDLYDFCSKIIWFCQKSYGNPGA